MPLLPSGRVMRAESAKPNVTAVSEYLEENKALPPGVNLNSTYVVGVRKA